MGSSPMQHAILKPDFIIGQDAKTIGNPILKRLNTSTNVTTTTRYLRIPLITMTFLVGKIEDDTSNVNSKM